MTPRVTVEWTLRRDHSDVRCTRCETDRGIELSVTFCGLLVARRRESWQAAGYELLRATT